MSNKSYSNYKHWYKILQPEKRKEKLDVKDLTINKNSSKDRKKKFSRLPKDQSSVENIKTKCKPQVYWTALGTTNKFSPKMGKEEKEKQIEFMLSTTVNPNSSQSLFQIGHPCPLAGWKPFLNFPKVFFFHLWFQERGYLLIRVMSSLWCVITFVSPSLPSKFVSEQKT